MSTAETGRRRVLGQVANDGDALDLVLVQWQHVALVFQQHDAFASDVQSDLVAGGAVHVVRGQRCELVELVQVDVLEDAADLVVDGRHVQLAAVQVRLEHLAVHLAAHHVQVGAGLCRWQTVDDGVVVTLDQTLEAPFLFQDIGDQVLVLASVLAVHLLERAHHHRHGAVLGGGLERRQGHLAQDALRHDLIEDETVGFLIVTGVVLGFCPDATLLDTVDHRWTQAGAEERVFTGEVFEGTAAPRHAVQVHARTGDELVAATGGVVAQGAAEVDGATRVEGGRQVRAGRIDHARIVAFAGVTDTCAAVSAVDLWHAVLGQRLDVPTTDTADVGQLFFLSHLRQGFFCRFVSAQFLGRQLLLGRGVGCVGVADGQAQQSQCRVGTESFTVSHRGRSPSITRAHLSQLTRHKPLFQAVSCLYRSSRKNIGESESGVTT